MEYLESVKTLRESIEQKQLNVMDKPGTYRWWFKEDAANKLVSNIRNASISQCQTRVIDGETYVALYFGISINLKKRFKWHICQKHTKSAVKSGFLSTLRQTISALMSCPMTRSEDCINKLMDDNCYLEWSYTGSKKDAEELETEELSQKQFAYPLNNAKNKTVTKEHLEDLTELRREYKK